MRIRNGFVSNSSASSFICFGLAMDLEAILENLKPVAEMGRLIAEMEECRWVEGNVLEFSGEQVVEALQELSDPPLCCIWEEDFVVGDWSTVSDNFEIALDDIGPSVEAGKEFIRDMFGEQFLEKNKIGLVHGPIPPGHS